MFNLKARLTTIEDYPELVEWWKFHRWSVPPSTDLLDDLRHGIIISLDGENICAGFVYFTNARAFGLLEFIVSTNKVRDKDIRAEALHTLIEVLKQAAKNKGVKMLFSSLNNPKLVQHYLDCGFVIGSENTKEMTCKL
ncbi:hypothetical protein [Wenyingzhuangia sp. 2_MG-2023]|uniref:hypothetical protein n=1 Tax=Wenyingzhuangia sp. 2_MG-2023 TaxID=3062639 RepID=UPI0026E2F87E|nr:hypothetical protein [Wenyingzhuangia sp. 2_MG-2023]MDO6737118.1 hypothetical protein [Wenyingzhuangia sp. 2_MG-2023]